MRKNNNHRAIFAHGFRYTKARYEMNTLGVQLKMGDGIKLHVRSFRNKHRGVHAETPRCSRLNTAVFVAKRRVVSSNHQNEQSRMQRYPKEKENCKNVRVCHRFFVPLRCE